MTKDKKQDGGWQFPKALEIVKCAQRGDRSEIRFLFANIRWTATQCRNLTPE